MVCDAGVIPGRDFVDSGLSCTVGAMLKAESLACVDSTIVTRFAL